MYENNNLNAWLQKVDMYYIDGRFLWNVGSIGSATILLWYSFEQIIKILILQEKFPEKQETVNNSKEAYNDTYNKINNKAKKIGGHKNKQDYENLLAKFKESYPKITVDNKFKEALKKLCEYFNMRYPINEGNSIPHSLIKEIDEFFFFLRSYVREGIGFGLIDEIVYYLNYNDKRSCLLFFDYYWYATKDNEYFRSRKHSLLTLNNTYGNEEIKLNPCSNISIPNFSRHK